MSQTLVKFVGKNKEVINEAQPSVSRMFLPHFGVICDVLLNRRTAKQNVVMVTSVMRSSSNRSSVRTNQITRVIQFFYIK